MPERAVGEHIPVGGNGNERFLRQRGTGGVVEEVEVVGDATDLLQQILTELRRQTRLLALIADEDIEQDDDES